MHLRSESTLSLSHASAGVFHRVLVDSEVGGDVFLLNVVLSLNYMAL
jgi:hypothetical protein